MADTAVASTADVQPLAAAATPDKPTPSCSATAATAEQDAPGSRSEDVQLQKQMVEFKIQYGKQSADLKRAADSTVGELKAEVEKTLGIKPEMQKLMFKGLLKTDAATLQQVGIKNGSKVLLVGSSQADVAQAKPQDANSAAPTAWDAPSDDKPLSEQEPHAKVIAKGKPEDAMPGIKDKQQQFAEGQNSIQAVLNSQGTKVRLTFKDDMQQIWIGSATSTQKVAYGSVRKIENWPISGQEEYSILALHLGTTTGSKYWLYYVPSQYVAAIKMRVIGIQALI